MFKVLIVALLLVLSKCAYEPELMLTAQPQFLNRFVANYSDTIIDTINNFTVPDIPTIEEKVEGVKVSISLSKIKQKVAIHWATNIVTVKDRHTFKINSKNINITLDAHI